VLASCKKKTETQHLSWLPIVITESRIHRVLHGLANERISGIFDRFGGKKFALYRVAHFFSRRFDSVMPVHGLCWGGRLSQQTKAR
jgi:hypothetical protein